MLIWQNLEKYHADIILHMEILKDEEMLIIKDIVSSVMNIIQELKSILSIKRNNITRKNAVYILNKS